MSYVWDSLIVVQNEKRSAYWHHGPAVKKVRAEDWHRQQESHLVVQHWTVELGTHRSRWVTVRSLDQWWHDHRPVCSDFHLTTGPLQQQQVFTLQPSHYNATKVYQPIKLRQKLAMGWKWKRYDGMSVGMRLSKKLVGSVRREKGRCKIYFLAGRAVYFHYFKEICQGALQYDCVMLFSGAGVPREGTAIS